MCGDTHIRTEESFQKAHYKIGMSNLKIEMTNLNDYSFLFNFTLFSEDTSLHV